MEPLKLSRLSLRSCLGGSEGSQGRDEEQVYLMAIEEELMMMEAGKGEGTRAAGQRKGRRVDSKAAGPMPPLRKGKPVQKEQTRIQKGRSAISMGRERKETPLLQQPHRLSSFLMMDELPRPLSCSRIYSIVSIATVSSRPCPKGTLHRLQTGALSLLFRKL